MLLGAAAAAVALVSYAVLKVPDFYGLLAALSVIVGVVVAIVSLAKPEQEAFDSRARILFKRQSGPHVDYIVERLKQTLEQYAESCRIRVIVKDYDAPTGRYYISQDTETIIRSYVDDVASTYSSRIAMAKVAQPPAGRQTNRLTHLRIGVSDLGAQDFATGIELPFDTTIPAGSKLAFDHGYEFWVQGTHEKNSFTPIRYTQALQLTVENRLPGGAEVPIRFSLDGRNFSGLRLRPGEAKVLRDVRELRPMSLAYDFRIEALTPSGGNPS